MTEKLQSYLAGKWQDGAGSETELKDPTTGEVLAIASAKGLDLAAALDFARSRGGAALQELGYGQRAELLGKIADVLIKNRAQYEATAIANSGNTRRDAAIDIDGGIGTLKYYAKLGAGLGGARSLLDQGPVRLAKDESFQAIHLLVPRRGVAVHINAFNFPSWGLWEKAAVSLLAGVPVLAKPASSTALLSAQMVRDVINAGVLPAGALSLLCGSAGDLLSRLTADDAVAFTGSHDTARRIRGERAVIDNNVSVNIEADSINSAVLAPDAAPGDASFNAFVREVAREMTVKAGQKCTAIRRVFAPAQHAAAVIEALSERLKKTVVGDPRQEATHMGPVVTAGQQAAVIDGIGQLTKEAQIVFGSGKPPKLDGIDGARSAFVSPTLLQANDAGSAGLVNSVEVFGPVATVLPYRNEADAVALVRAGGGSLAVSVFGDDVEFLARMSRDLGSAHGRVLVVHPSIADSHTGHGIVMPQCNHGGPGRAGNGEELGGLHGLRFYHQRVAVQGSTDTLKRLQDGAAPLR
ncbi:MAG: 3,4-dehydroadipyl-CoA semialdehyde dehydrogenase [Pseudolabrys sp.]